MVRFSRIASLLALLALAETAWAQGTLFDWPSPPGSTGLVPAGDVDGDGFDDFARGAPLDPATSDTGRVEVFSGADGATLAVVSGSSPGDQFGGRVAGVGDLDGDGRADLCAIAGLAGYVRAFSGDTGAQLWQVSAPAPLQFDSIDLAALGDVDLDGVNDLLVPARPTPPNGQAYAVVLSGATGAVVHVVSPVIGNVPSVTAVAGFEDRDGDGTPDFLVSVGDTSLLQPGVVTLYSGRHGTTLSVYRGAAGDISFGRALASLGDLNGDGVGDLAVASPSEMISSTSRGRVRLVSGADGAVLQTILPDASNLWDFGRRVANFGDADGDGIRDLALSAGSYRVGCCTFIEAGTRVYSGATGILLHYDGAAHSFQDAAPDANGDGITDYLVSNLFRDGQRYDGLLLGGWSAPGTWVCQAAKQTSQGCDAWLDTLGTPSLTLGADLMLRAQRTIPNTSGMFLWSRAPDFRPFRGGMLCLANTVERFPVVPTTSGQPPCSGSTENTGTMRFRVSKSLLGSLGFLPGDTFYVQGLFCDPGYAPPQDVGLTQSIFVTVWP